MNAAAAKNELIGAGSQDGDLTAEEMSKIVELALARIEEGAKVLAVVPDKTRDDNTDVLFPAAARSLEGKRVERFDALIAQGTHGRMSSAEKREKLGFGDGVSLEKLGSVYDHHWDDPNELTEIGEITATEVAEITGGIFNEAIPLKVNRLLAKGNYDHILIFGATVPHEVAGFAGGAKYFFPGVAGPELTHATHWLGALAGIENTIGRVETPTRRLIEAAADRVAADVICFTTAVTREEDDRLRTRGLFAGNYRESLRAGAAISTQVHIKYTDRKYKRVVALLDEHYDEMWVGGKASYKLGSIIEPGGELIIYAPQMTRISDTHGAAIEEYGYAPVEKIRTLVASGHLTDNLAVAAHLAHVAFGSRKDETGEIQPRYKITLVSSINKTTVEKVNLNYMPLSDFEISEYENDADTLIVPRAGRDLYLVA